MRWYPSAWSAVEEHNVTTLVSVGRTETGERAVVRITPCKVHALFKIPPTIDAASSAQRVWWHLTNRARSVLGSVGDSSYAVTVVSARSLYGYTDRDALFLRVEALGESLLREATRTRNWGALGFDRRDSVEVFEPRVSALTRLMQRLECGPHDVLEIDGDRTRATVDVTGVRVPRVPGWPERMLVCSFDAEVFSSDLRSFPSATNEGDHVAQIGAWVSDGTKKLFAWQPTSPIEGTDVVVARDEASMIVAFLHFVRDHDVDVLTGYNTFGFDYSYILDRLESRGGSAALDSLDSLGAGAARRVERSIASAAYGCNEHVLIEIPGRINIDLLVYLRRDLKLESFKLDAVARFLTGDSKIDLPPAQIFAKIAGTADDRAEVGVYCMKDTKLVLDIFSKRSVLYNLLEAGNVAGIQCGDVLSRGMQIQVYTQIVTMANALGYVIPVVKEEGDGYQGATVLHADSGVYYEAVAGLDFASLYPSVMIAGAFFCTCIYFIMYVIITWSQVTCATRLCSTTNRARACRTRPSATHRARWSRGLPSHRAAFCLKFSRSCGLAARPRGNKWRPSQTCSCRSS
jgi:DNA polymerase delta subunit 1